MLEVNAHSASAAPSRGNAAAAPSGAAGVFAALMSADASAEPVPAMPLQALVPEAAELAAQAGDGSAADPSPATQQPVQTAEAVAKAAVSASLMTQQDLAAEPLPVDAADDVSGALAQVAEGAQTSQDSELASLSADQLPEGGSQQMAGPITTVHAEVTQPVSNPAVLPDQASLAAHGEQPVATEELVAPAKELGRGAEAVASILKSADERPARPGLSIASSVAQPHSAVASVNADVAVDPTAEADFKLPDAAVAALAQKAEVQPLNPTPLGSQVTPTELPHLPTVSATAQAQSPDASLAGLRADTPLPANQFSEHVLAHIRQRGDDQFEAKLALHPAELGDLSLQIEQDGQRLELKISVDNEQARRVIGEQLNQLRERLGDLGMQLGQANVEVRQDQQRQDSDTPSPAKESMLAEDVKEPSARPHLLSRNGLDLYA